MRRANLACGGFLLALGAVALVEAARINDEWPGARLLPALVGGVLVVLGVAHLVGPGVEAESWPDAAGWRRIGAVFVALVLYVAVLPWTGFLPPTVLFVLFLVRALGTYSWLTALVVAGAISLASEVIFVRWLGMPLG